MTMEENALFTGTTQSGLVIENGVVKNGKACEGEIRVPDGVTAIGDQAFYRNKKLTGLYLPDGVATIGKYTVNGCQSLEYVRVPESVERLGDGALVKKIESNCGFTHVVESKEYYPQIRCKEGSFIDQTIQEMKRQDGWQQSHSNEHIVEVLYEQ